MRANEFLTEKWSKKYKQSINCNNPKGFSQKAHCAGRKARQGGRKTKSSSVSEATDPYDYDWKDLGKTYDLDPFKQEYKPKINWPPSPSEVRDIERRILQDPEWLNFYKRFGWDSWTGVPQTHIWFDKHNKLVTFYDVPAIAKEWRPGEQGIVPDRTMVKMDLQGNLMPLNKNDIILPRVMDMLRDYIRQTFTKDNLRYMTERYYVRFGRWKDDERSQNYLATKEQGRPVFEKGVSAYHAEYNPEEKRWAIADGINEDTITGTLASLLYDPNKKIFLVQGTELDEDGADGEPLLHDVKLIKPLKVTDVYVPGVYDPREEGLSEAAIKLRGFGPSEKTKEFVAKVYNMYQESPISPSNRLMIFGKGNDMSIVQFELTPKQKNIVELKWIQATPMRVGAGSKAIKILQDLAEKDGITLTLYPWDKGQVPQAKLMKFYKKQGFSQMGKSKNMIWEPKVDG